ncbi:uncharacterized protein METZ01_LOCUS332584, partial [marine metagenome]
GLDRNGGGARSRSQTWPHARKDWPGLWQPRERCQVQTSSQYISSRSRRCLGTFRKRPARSRGFV